MRASYLVTHNHTNVDKTNVAMYKQCTALEYTNLLSPILVAKTLLSPKYAAYVSLPLHAILPETPIHGVPRGHFHVHQCVPKEYTCPPTGEQP